MSSFTPGTEQGAWISNQIGNDPNQPGIKTNRQDRIQWDNASTAPAGSGVGEKKTIEGAIHLAILLVFLALAVVPIVAHRSTAGTWPSWAVSPLFASMIGLVEGMFLGALAAGFFASSGHKSTSKGFWRGVSLWYRWISGIVTFAMVTVCVPFLYFPSVGFASAGVNHFEGMYAFGIDFKFQGFAEGLFVMSVIVTGINFILRMFYIGSR